MTQKIFSHAITFEQAKIFGKAILEIQLLKKEKKIDHEIRIKKGKIR